jgi:hypothetical protein
MKGKVWVLDTETKGTGAQMVPLESVTTQPRPKEHFLPATARRHKTAPQPVERAPRRFRVTDVASRRVLGDELDARATLALLAGQRSSVDVNVSVWEPDEARWRLLTLSEKQLLWERRSSGSR